MIAKSLCSRRRGGAWFASLVGAWLVLGALSSPAQWLTQTNVLKPGWTAVYFNVDASSQTLDSLVGFNPACPIDQVWLWKTLPSPAQYISSPASPLAGSSQWLTYYRPSAGSVSTLSALQPNAAYLVHNAASTNYNWEVQGQPVPPSYIWDNTGLNFIGFSTPYATPPTFQNFLAQSPLLAGGVQIYQYTGGAFGVLNPAPLFSLYTTPVTRGQAYWVSDTNINNTYFGPFKVGLPNPSGINFGESGGQLTFHLVNSTSNSLVVTMTCLPSETPPAGQPVITGVPPLLLRGGLNSSNLSFGYTSLGLASPGGATNRASWTLAPSGQPGSDIPVVLGVNRYAMTNSLGSLYAGILQFTDSLGFSAINIPVSATAANSAGLWVGGATVNQVSYDLKSYATNADGSLVVSAVTNQVMTTNLTTLGITTNLAITYSISTNTAVNYYNVTNLVINTYTTNGLQVRTNGLVVSTNLVINLTSTTNLVIETDVTGYYFTNDDSLLVWETANTTNGPFITTVPTSTNVTYLTNLLAVVSPNGTPAAIVNTSILVYNTASQVVTNGIFLDPVTNTIYTGYEVANSVAGTGPEFNQAISNWVAFSFAVTNGPAGTNFVVTNAPIVSVNVPVTNYYPTLKPLLVATNHGQVITFNAITNNYLFIASVNPVYLTNYVTVSNNFTIASGSTNLVSSVTNPVSVTFAGPSLVLTNRRAFLTLATATNSVYLITTNPLVSSVSNYVVTAHNTALDAVTTAYPLRLIIFNDTNGACSLLQRVYFGLNPATNLVVATRENLLDPTHLNLARRISATQLPWAANNTPFYFTGGSLGQGAVLTTTVTEQYDDQASNPFLHTYHPDHNNLDYSQNPPHELPQGSESYTVTRVIQLAVVPNASDFGSLTTANTVLSGTYNETITLAGLGGATRSYQTAGTFALKQISTIPTLTTQ